MPRGPRSRPASLGPPESSTVAPTVDTDRFVGRRAELSSLLAARGPTCLRGASGIGKTALLRAATRSAARVLLVTAGPPEANRLRDALREMAGGLEGPALSSWLRSSSTLLTIDGLERWPPSTARALLTTLGDAPFVYTSFVPLGLPGETTITLGPLPPAEAEALVRARGGPPGAFSAWADGSPLALEILAGWIGAAPEDPCLVEAACAEAPPPLSPAEPSGRRGLAGVITAARSTLSPAAVRVLDVLAVVPDAAPLEALAELSGERSEPALLGLGELVARRLAAVAAGRAASPEAVRALVAADLAACERHDLAQAHTAWCARLVQGLPQGHGGFDGGAAYALVRSHQRHLEAACEHALAFDPCTAATLALALDPLHVLAGDSEAQAVLLERAAEAVTDPTLRAECLLRLARIASLRGMAGVALQIASDAAALSSTAPATRARIAGARAHAHLLLNEGAAGLLAAEACRTAAEEVPDTAERDRLLAFAHQELAVAHGQTGAPDAARTHHEMSVVLARKRGATRMLALALANAAMATSTTGAERGARLAESLALFEAVGDRRHVVKLRYWMIQLAPDARQDALLETLAVAAAAIDDDGTHTSVRLDLASRAFARGDLDAAKISLAGAQIPLAFSDDPHEHARAARLGALLSGTPPGRQLRLRRDGTRIFVDDQVIDLDNRRALPALVAALGRDATCDAPAGLDVTEMFQAGWPNQRASVGSLAARVHVGVRTLRTLGLGAVLVTRRGRYGFADDVTVSWLDLA